MVWVSLFVFTGSAFIGYCLYKAGFRSGHGKGLREGSEIGIDCALDAVATMGVDDDANSFLDKMDETVTAKLFEANGGVEC